jgi:hypothetical protein
MRETKCLDPSFYKPPTFGFSFHHLYNIFLGYIGFFIYTAFFCFFRFHRFFFLSSSLDLLIFSFTLLFGRLFVYLLYHCLLFGWDYIYLLLGAVFGTCYGRLHCLGFLGYLLLLALRLFICLFSGLGLVGWTLVGFY